MDGVSAPPGGYTLRRWPAREDDPLQAWDGADRYLLEALAERAAPGPVLVVDDVFGALGCALAPRALAWGDSEVGRLALQHNLRRNGLPAVPWVPLSEPPPAQGVVAVVGRLPKSIRRLEYILSVLAPALAPGTPVLFGDKSKNVQRSAVAAMEAALGPASSTRAAHRARLVVATRDGRTAPAPSGAGVFGEDRIDRGSALLLEALAAVECGTDVVDLGCGTGTLGRAAAARDPSAAVLFCDESHLAVAAARASFRAAGLSNPARFVAQDVLVAEADASADLVLCNPPFHQGQVITRRVAAQMFLESARVLRPGGRLLVVGNRHLRYHERLPRHFRSVEVARASPKFVVLEAVR